MGMSQNKMEPKYGIKMEDIAYFKGLNPTQPGPTVPASPFGW